jgi:hypothetical protein
LALVLSVLLRFTDSDYPLFGHENGALDNIILENSSNNKTYWKIMKMLLELNKGSANFPPLQANLHHM